MVPTISWLHILTPPWPRPLPLARRSPPSNLDRSSHAAMERQPASGCLAICTSVHRSERRVTRWTFLAAPQTTSWPLHSHVPLTSPTPHCPSPPSAHPAPTLLMLRAIPPRRGCHQPAPRLLTPRRSPCAAPLPLHQLDRVSSASSAAETYSIALPSQTGPTLRAKALRATGPQTQTLHSPPRPAQRRSATACVRRGRSSSAAS